MSALDAFPAKTDFYAFEPSPVACAELDRRFGRLTNCTIERLACSSEPGLAELHFDVAGSSHASLHRRNLSHLGTSFAESTGVQVVRLADYCAQHDIDHIDFLKIDVEGDELNVLRGARELIDSRRILAIQLEMGGADVDSRTF